VAPETQFDPPSERSLVGLVGLFEVPVSADARGHYAAGVIGVSGQGSEPVQGIGSIDLAQAVKASMGFSRDVLVASSKLDQAVAQTGQARAFLLPSLVLSAKTGTEVSEPGVNVDPATGKVETRNEHSRSDTSITLKQPLYDGPSMYDWKRRKVIEQSRELGRDASLGDAYLSTVNAYLSLASSRLLSDMAVEYEDRLATLFQYIEKRAGAGAASNSDKERVRARRLNAQSARMEQEAAHAAAGVEFVRLVNLAPTYLRLPDREDVGLASIPRKLEQAMSMAVSGNPDVAVLEAELRAAQLDISGGKARYMPRFDLEYSLNDSLHAGGASGSQRDQRLMLAMNWSLFNGGGDRKYADEKVARYNEIRYKLDDQRRRVLQTLTAQYATLEATRQRLASGYLELDSLSSAAKSVSTRMLSGNQSLLDVLDVYDRYYQSRTRLVTLHVQEIGSIAQIARLVQGVPSSQSTPYPVTQEVPLAADTKMPTDSHADEKK
jgi:adhesin transport system outer membrane protein